MATESAEAALGKAVQSLREWLGLSQEELAAQAEVSRSTVQNIEAGRRVPRPASLRRIARALDTDVATLRREVSADHERPSTDDRADRRDEILREILDRLREYDELDTRRDRGRPTGT